MRYFCGSQNTYDRVSHHVINRNLSVFSLLVVTGPSVFQQSCNTTIRSKSLGDITLRKTNKALKNQEGSTIHKFKANLGNFAINKKRHTTPLDVPNKAPGDGYVLKKSSHATKDKIKVETHICIRKTQPEADLGLLQHRRWSVL